MQKCDAVQERLANLVIRLACQSPENAATLVRPVLLLLQQRTAAAAKSLLSETDISQVSFGIATLLDLTASIPFSEYLGQANKNAWRISYVEITFVITTWPCHCLQGTHMLRWVTLLAAHPSSKVTFSHA